MAKLMAVKRASTTTKIKSLGVTAEWGLGFVDAAA